MHKARSEAARLARPHGRRGGVHTAASWKHPSIDHKHRACTRHAPSLMIVPTPAGGGERKSRGPPTHHHACTCKRRGRHGGRPWARRDGDVGKLRRRQRARRRQCGTSTRSMLTGPKPPRGFVLVGRHGTRPRPGARCAIWGRESEQANKANPPKKSHNYSGVSRSKQTKQKNPKIT